MPAFSYRAIDAQGRVRNGTLEAEDLPQLTAALKKTGSFLMDARRTQLAPRRIEINKAVEPVIPLKPATSRRHSLSLERIAIFTTELSVMTRTALPILENLQTLSHQEPDKRLQKILIDITSRVQQGGSLSDAFAAHPEAFDDVYISLLRAGEASGTLSIMLERLVGYLNFQRDLKAKVRSALIYPTIVVLTTIAVVGCLVFFILPNFAELFLQMNTQLPFPTRFLLGMTHHLRSYWWLYGTLLAGFWTMFLHWMSDPTHSEPFERLQLRLPLVGPLVRNIVMTRILRTLGALVASGVPILHSLNLARASAGNMVFNELFRRVYDYASRGQGLAAALYGNPYFPETVANMIANGENTGTLPDVLNKIADYYERETDIALHNFFAALEPLFVLILGMAVALIAIAMLLPIFNLTASIS